MHSWRTTVGEGKGGSLLMGKGDGQNDQFPVGMRVLAVDDDPTCLKVLEAMLLRCGYNVTTTNQAVSALELLRENKNRFDLVISDVHMPDMDGFRLLELVGLEMDLPVIMLSVNGETKTVMKGITHGACDYLLKPVRIEELKNIWQHVVRRRKLAHKEYNHFDDGEESDKHQIVSKESADGLNMNSSPNSNEKFIRKRKDQNDEGDDNSEENDDTTTQKKPRVVWSIDLHRKFVAAVNQLGIDKAVPKRILELMNVEKLTRENVASHLQKYRLYLKRLSAAASRQVNMVAAFGGRNSYISSLDGFGSFHALGASGQLQALRSLQPCEVLVKANTSGLGIHDLSSSRIIQVGSSNSIIPSADISRLPAVIHASNQHGRLLQGVPASLELEQMQLKRIQEPSSHFPGFLSGNAISIPSSSFLDVASHAFITQSLEQQTPSSATVGLSSGRSLPTTFDPLHVSVGFSSQLPNAGRLKADSQSAVPLTQYPTIVSFTNNDDLSKYLDKGETGNSKQRAPEEGKYEQEALFNFRSSTALCTNFVPNSPGNQRVNSHHNTSSSIFPSNCQIGKLTADGLQKEIMNVQEGTELSGYCLDDVIGSLIKQEKGRISLSENDSESDHMYQFDACM